MEETTIFGMPKNSVLIDSVLIIAVVSALIMVGRNLDRIETIGKTQDQVVQRLLSVEAVNNVQQVEISEMRVRYQDIYQTLQEIKTSVNKLADRRYEK